MVSDDLPGFEVFGRPGDMLDTGQCGCISGSMEGMDNMLAVVV